MKSKYYCQLCKRGMDSEANFKAHLVTPAHLLQKSAYDKNPSVYTEHLSGMFTRQFLEVLWKKFGYRAENVNRVYFLHLSDSTSVRLTSTKWVTLGEFLDWLDKNFKDQCEIIRDSKTSETFVQLLDQNCLYLDKISDNENTVSIFEKAPLRENHQSVITKKPKSLFNRSKTIAHSFGIGNKRKHQCDENNEMKNVKCARTQSKFCSDNDVADPFNVDGLLEEEFSKNKNGTTECPKKPWPLSRDRICISFNPSDNVKSSTHQAAKSVSSEDFETSTQKQGSAVSLEACVAQEESLPRSWKPVKQLKQKHSALEELKEEQEAERERQNRSDNWLCTNIIVRIVTKRLGKKYHQHKALVIEVKHKYTALLQFLDGKDTLLYADQCHLKPVIPQTGERVAIVNGAYRGHLGILKNKSTCDCDISPHKDLLCSVVIDQGIFNGRLVQNISSEDIAELRTTGI